MKQRSSTPVATHLALVGVILLFLLPTQAVAQACGDLYEPDDPGTAEPPWIGDGESQTRSFCPQGDVDQARFRVKAGRWYDVHTYDLGHLVDTVLTIEGVELVYEDDDGGSESLASRVYFQAPSTGDLMCVWNQVSSDEIRLGYRRGRLSVAISSDGETWKHVKTLEQHGALEDRAYIPPEEKLQLARSLPDVGDLDRDWGVSDYATITFHGDDVIIGYVQQKGLDTDRISSHKIRVIPLDWFYKD